MGIDTAWRYFPWPSYFLKAVIRKKMNPEKLGPTEAHRKSTFHRISILYIALAWTGVGVGAYLMFQPRVVKLEDNREMLPHQIDIDRGGALYWVQALKTPEDLMDSKQVNIIKFKGLSYKGVEDVTVQAKEIGQQKMRINEKQGDDYFLRKWHNIELEEEGGPSNAEIRKRFKAEGRDYEISLDFANRMHGQRTTYNPDGTVGTLMTKSDHEAGRIVPESNIS